MDIGSILLIIATITGISDLYAYIANTVINKGMNEEINNHGYERNYGITPYEETENDVIYDRNHPLNNLIKTSIIPIYNIFAAFYISHKLPQFFDEMLEILEDLKIIRNEPYRKKDGTIIVKPIDKHEKIKSISIESSETDIIVQKREQTEPFKFTAYDPKTKCECPIYYYVAECINGRVRIYDTCCRREGPLKLVVSLSDKETFNYFTIRSLYGNITINNPNVSNLSVTAFDGDIKAVTSSDNTSLVTYRGNIKTTLLGYEDDYYISTSSHMGSISGLYDTELEETVISKHKRKGYRAKSVFGNIRTKNRRS